MKVHSSPVELVGPGCRACQRTGACNTLTGSSGDIGGFGVCCGPHEHQLQLDVQSVAPVSLIRTRTFGGGGGAQKKIRAVFTL